MKTNYAGHVYNAVLAYRSSDLDKQMEHEHKAFMSQRKLLLNADTHAGNSMCEMYPALPVSTLSQLIDVYGADGKQDVIRAIRDNTECAKDLNIASAIWQYLANSRVSRSSCISTITKVRRAVAATGANCVIVGDFARHIDMLDRLEFCIENSTCEQLIDSIGSTTKCQVSSVSDKEVRWYMEIEGQRILCVGYIVQAGHLSAGTVFFTGPKAFIKKLNAKMIRYGYSLTEDGLVDAADNRIPCTTEQTIWDIVGAETPPTSTRGSIDCIICDTHDTIRMDTKTQDTGIMLRTGGIQDSMEENLKRGLADVSYFGVVAIGMPNEKETKRDLDLARMVVGRTGQSGYVGLLVNENSMASLVHADKADYLVLESNSTSELFEKLLPAAKKAKKQVVVRNPLMFVNGMSMLTERWSKSSIITLMERTKCVVEISGGSCYEGTPIEATQDLMNSRCKLTLGSACDPWNMPSGLYAARTKCSQALMKRKRLLSSKAFEKWVQN